MNTICIATISLAQTLQEENLLRRSLSALLRHKLPIFITDGGSSGGFVDWLKSQPGFTLLPSAKGVFAQARSSVLAAAASGASAVVYTEPDKLNFFEDGLSSFLQTASANERPGVVLASRSAKAFASFPAFQQLTESTINRCCAERTGLQADFCYGPFLLNARLAVALKDVHEDIGWGWRPFLFQTAQRKGFSMQAVQGDFFCPADQREDDAPERLYRMKQLEQNIRGLVLAG